MGATYHTPLTATAVPDVPQPGTAAGSSHPLIEAARQLGPIIQEHANEAEGERRLSKPVQDAFAAAGLHRMMTPRSLDGLEVDPVTVARIVEEVANFDTAAAWSLQAANVNSWWAARLSDLGAEELYGASPSVMAAAAFHPPQQAIEVAGGYRVTGRAPLASNVHDCDWILLSTFIMEGGRPRMTEHGPEMIAIILRTSEVEIIDTWYSLGMRGTDSNDVIFTDVYVPTHRTFVLAPEFKPGRHFQGPLYRFPAGPIITLFSSAVLMAAARGAISEFRELAQKKVAFGSMKTLRERGTVQSSLAEAEATLRSARALFYDTMSETWARTVAGQPSTLEQKADVLLASIHAVKSSATVTDTIHRLAGTTGIYTKSRIERYFRDAHTLRHHGFVSENKLEAIGQIYLGLEPDFPLIAF